MDFIIKSFSELSLEELYRILQIRAEVFVVEQDCVYQDLDGKDISCHHVLGYVNGSLEAYTRIVPPGLSYKEFSSIGRVLTTMLVRRGGFGRALMKESIKYCLDFYSVHKIKISAQTYLIEFYSKLGFSAVGDGYLEDGIPHIGMIYNK